MPTPTKISKKRKPPANNAANVAAYRERQKAAGMVEVRGIFAKPEQHAEIKKAAGIIKVGITQPPSLEPVVSTEVP